MGKQLRFLLNLTADDIDLISCGLSESNCPEVFKLKDGMATVLENVNYSGLEEKIIDAAESCPVEVIKYEEA